MDRDHAALAARIDDLLPQTQCRRCGYAGCAPYADAISTGDAEINRCPPGGDATIATLAALLVRAPMPLDTSRGEHTPFRIAKIVEADCIGCTLCIAACPVDAIIGAQKRMHAVLPSLCSGCELCVPACPVDCIVMEPADREWARVDADAARQRHTRRQARIAAAKAQRVREAEVFARKQAIDAAFVRARERRTRSTAAS